MGLVYGIDFGTSNSAIMVGLPDGTVRRIMNPVEGIYEIPSVICMNSDGVLVVGSRARRIRLQRPAWYREEFKRDMGSSDPVLFPPERGEGPGKGRFVEVTALVAQVLRELREKAQHDIPGDVDLAVITVPASWRESNREQMRRAAVLAGFDPAQIQLATEPEAAVAYAAREHLGLDEQTLLVYDLGGGTFDCAVVRGNKSGYRVMGEAGGLDYIGGVHFREKILELVVDKYPEKMADLRRAARYDIRSMKDLLQVQDACEVAKRELSSADRFEFFLPELGPDVGFPLTRTHFADLITPMLMETVTECQRMLQSAGLDWSGVDMVIPVGGSSRSPVVGETIARHSGNRTSVLRLEDPEFAVAHGATLLAFAFAGSRAGHASPSPVARPVAPPPAPSPAPAAPPRPVRRAVGRVPAGPVSSGPVHAAVPASPSAPSFVPASPVASAGKHVATAEPPIADTSTPAPPRRLESMSESASFPAPGLIFTARNAGEISRVWRLRTSVTTAVLFTVALTIANFFDIPGPAKSGQQITQSELTIAAYYLAFASMALLLLTAWALVRARRAGWWNVSLALFIGGAAATHYFLHGWPGWVVLGIALLIAFFTWLGVLVEEIPWKEKYVRTARFDATGFTLIYADKAGVSYNWGQIGSIVAASNRVRAVFSEGPDPNYGSRIDYNSKDRTAELFGRFHFTAEGQLFDAIDHYSGRKLVAR